MAAPPTAAPTETPRPTVKAFQPASSKDIWPGVGLGFLCLAGAVIGLGAWFDPTLLDVPATTATASGSGWWLTLCLPFIFPIFVPVAFYLWWSTARHWWQTRQFNRNCVTTTGAITHLWIDPPKPPGKKYYVGYHFGQDHTAFQSVHARTFNRLAIGQAVVVQYAASQPNLSLLDLQKKPDKRN